mmetsp:Transcript_53252/g.105010  ORF Transcript_53252/g.105010 Transcript_53252/m.105010 type:complete len:208 (-) Transcript_53252:89-712(-)
MGHWRYSPRRQWTSTTLRSGGAGKRIGTLSARTCTCGDAWSCWGSMADTMPTWLATVCAPTRTAASASGPPSTPSRMWDRGWAAGIRPRGEALQRCVRPADPWTPKVRRGLRHPRRALGRRGSHAGSVAFLPLCIGHSKAAAGDHRCCVEGHLPSPTARAPFISVHARSALQRSPNETKSGQTLTCRFCLHVTHKLIARARRSGQRF